MSKHIVETVRSKFDNQEMVLPEDIAELLDWAERVRDAIRNVVAA